jgi:hypothetical protein
MFRLSFCHAKDNVKVICVYVKGHVKQPVCDSHDSLLSNFSLLFTPEKHTLRWQRGAKDYIMSLSTVLHRSTLVSASKRLGSASGSARAFSTKHNDLERMEQKENILPVGSP